MTKTPGTIEATDRCTMRTYARHQVVFVRGEGRRLWDENGKSYLDLFSGLGVSCLGHAHPAVVKAITEQAASLMHTSNLFYHEPGAELARRLVEQTFADRVFLCNSGAEANEAAIKMARRWRPERHEIVTAFESFHGRTLAALAASGQPKLHEGFGPIPAGFVHVPYNDSAALAKVLGPQTAAVLLEPVLGEGGIIVPDDSYLQEVREACNEAGVLLILDEVQTGCGRTGTLYAYQGYDVLPDILTSAKGLAGGLPVGAVLATEAASSGFVPGSHGSTFGANPVVCRAALAVLDTFAKEDVLENCRQSGDHLHERLKELALVRDDVVEVRGRGLMQAMEMKRPARPIVEAALTEGIVINATAATVLRFLPPLTVTIAEIDEGVDILARVLG